MGWTDESVEQLRKMWSEGLTANEIAKKLGVTKNAIVGKVHRLCLTARPSPIKSKGNIVGSSEQEQSEVSVTETVEEEFINQKSEAPKAAMPKSCKGHNIKLVDLDSHSCRWPIGDPRDDDFCFCGKKVRSGQTYCDEHSVVAYVKAVKK